MKKKAKDKSLKEAKILFIDIEATNLSASMGYLLSIGYKWAHEKKVTVLRIDDTKEWQKRKTDDRGLLRAFSPVYAEADLVVHHFGDYYDIPFLQTRRIIQGLVKMPDVTTVDTWRICRKHMKFHNNRLATIEKALNCPFSKTAVTGAHWINAMAGIKSGLNYVAEHNRLDVLVLEYVYNKIAAMLPSHPRVTPHKYSCKACGSLRTKGHGWKLCQSHWYQRILCMACGHTMKGARRQL